MEKLTYREIAVDFLKRCAKGDSRKAFELYTHAKLIHHNVYFNSNPETLMLAMEDSARVNPDKVFEIQRTLMDNNLVAVHSFVKQNEDDLGYAVMHIFRFENKKIVEMWDFGQAVPEEMVNENGMF
jgi:predicted SnoaL-like aldol condensation-catalyzing enzyme